MLYSRNAPHEHVPGVIQAFAPDWVKSSKARPTGPLTTLVPPDSAEASAIIYPTRPPHFPACYLRDDDSDGRIDQVQVDDASGRTFSMLDSDGDGRLDTFFYITRHGDSSIALEDSDMDGEYDHRLGPRQELSLRIRSDWHRATRKDGRYFVEMDGELVEVTSPDGKWEIAK